MGKTKELKPVGATADLDDVREDDNIIGHSQNGYGSIESVSEQGLEDSTEESAVNDVVPMTKNLRLFKTVCMLGIYIGMVSSLLRDMFVRTPH